VILYRCFPWDRSVEATAPGGAVWLPRSLQGRGRHDAPERYGCLYVSEEPASAVVESLAALVGTDLAPPDLVRGGLPLALASISLPDEGLVLDLDEPRVLSEEGLRPSAVATRERSRSRADAEALFDRHPDAAGIRWWSTFESRWANVTLFDRAAGRLGVETVRRLTVDDPVVGEAAHVLGLAARP
jgi:hypothetical protein